MILVPATPGKKTDPEIFGMFSKAIQGESEDKKEDQDEASLRERE
jgi:hypothetical protein